MNVANDYTAYVSVSRHKKGKSPQDVYSNKRKKNLQNKNVLRKCWVQCFFYHLFDAQYFPPNPLLPSPSSLSSANYFCRPKRYCDRVQRRRYRLITRSYILLNGNNDNDRVCTSIIRKNRRKASSPRWFTRRQKRSKRCIWKEGDPFVCGLYAFVVRKVGNHRERINFNIPYSNGRSRDAGWEFKESNPG